MHGTMNIKLICTLVYVIAPWQMGRPVWKLGGLERHLLTRVSSHFAFSQQMARVQSTTPWQTVNQSQTGINHRSAY